MEQATPEGLQFGRFSLDLIRGCVRMGEQEIDLPPKPFEVLRLLAEKAGQLVPKQELFATVWPNVAVTDDSLVQCIRELRSKLGDVDHRLIRTIPRRGYLLDARAAPADPPAVVPVAAIDKSTTALPDRPSLAVLPFMNMSGDPEQDYLAEGIAEEIITALSRCGSLLVIARNSSFAYQDRNIDVRQIGRELQVRYVLEGSVQRAGDRLRITTQLVEALSGTHLWADHFDGDRSEIFELQDRITASVAAAAEPNVQAAEIARLKPKSTPDLEAYDLMLRAQALERKYTEESLSDALQCLERAIAINPSYAPALALAAFCHCERRSHGWSNNPEVDRAEGYRLSIRALEHGRDDANVLWMVSRAVRVLGADTHGARELANRSLLLNPSSTAALTEAAWSELFAGNPQAALEFVRRAERLNPRDPKAWLTDSVAAHAHFAAGHLDEAVGRARKVLAQNAHFSPSVRVLAASLAMLGRRDEAAAAIRRLLSIEPDLTVRELRDRLGHQDTSVLNPFLEGLRMAGLPE